MTEQQPNVPPPPPMQQPRRRWLPWILVGAGGCLMLILLSFLGFAGCLALIAGSGGGGSGGGGSGADSYAEAKKAVPIGQTATAGDVAWTVHDAWQATELSSYSQKKRGNFIIVQLTFKNNGKEPVTLDSASLAILDDKGRTHETDTDASDVCANESRSVLKSGQPRCEPGRASNLRRGTRCERPHTQVRRH